jgi:hypothetical protein
VVVPMEMRLRRYRRRRWEEVEHYLLQGKVVRRAVPDRAEGQPTEILPEALDLLLEAQDLCILREKFFDDSVGSHYRRGQERVIKSFPHLTWSSPSESLVGAFRSRTGSCSTLAEDS